MKIGESGLPYGSDTDGTWLLAVIPAETALATQIIVLHCRLSNIAINSS